MAKKQGWAEGSYTAMRALPRGTRGAIRRWFCSGCSIMFHALSGNRQQTRISPSVGGWRPGMRVQHGRVLVRAPFLVCRRPPAPCGLTWQQESLPALWPLFITLVTSSNPNHLPKAPPDTTPLGWGSTYE